MTLICIFHDLMTVSYWSEWNENSWSGPFMDSFIFTVCHRSMVVMGLNMTEVVVMRLI